MYTDKKNIPQLVALLEAYGITEVVLCPGSRNTPIMHALSNHPNFACYPATDERSAGYFAISLALNDGKPTAVCCTPGTALLDLHPVIAEAFYQNAPLTVISADRPAAWIGQMDGQTVPQPGVFQTLVRKLASLPEIHTEGDEWRRSRLVNEALLETNHHGKDPVHTNVPISEPLFQFMVNTLPEIRVITRYQGLNAYNRDRNDPVDRMNKYQKRTVIIGRMSLTYLSEKRYVKLLYKHFAWLTEHINNQAVPGIPVGNFDTALCTMPKEKADQVVPELLITYGRHVVSERLKKFLRQHPPREHWHVPPDGEVVDLYGSLTTVIEMDPFEFLEKIVSLLGNRTPDYPRVQENYYKVIPELDFVCSEMLAIGTLLKALPESCMLHLADSSVARYAQLYSVPPTVEVCRNRGTSSIEGLLSTAVGHVAASNKLNFMAVGDLNFFYDTSTLRNINVHFNLYVLLLNNRGGEAFHILPELNMSDTPHKFTVVVHRTSTKGWVEERGLLYLQARNDGELAGTMKTFTQSETTEQPVLLEVFTNKDKDTRMLKNYYHQLKQK